MMAGRIDAFYGKSPKLAEFAPAGILGELARLNYDTANATSAPDHGGTVEVRARVTDHLRHRLPLFPAHQHVTLAQSGLSPPT